MPSNPDLLVSPKQRHGSDYEQLAADFLQQQGLVLIASNWQQPKVGEIDLVMLQSTKHWDTLVFIEVRKRKVSGYGDALTSVTKAKQRKLIKTAKYFLQRHPQYAHLECRFDVVAYNEPKTIQFETKQTKTGQVDSEPLMLLPEWVQSAFMGAAW
ncbi:YraN family protein [Psychrobacter sp. FDAARGOS_221]|uniref:YraN family protein n=1 Tax=Psychrobacter sp. FDAARGOS_221 TaxID=1975705 RepID=UPI000BB53BF0|nr:YraN family protein [Psychrobacter sp. FDAARGOS_221]PNK60262.1 YraN family protein [Psychrobacter sp. FDAARGOS_221]